ncbi:MAG: hydrogenase maturation nickel metallochaperone HypA [Gammaproteobacteria bacterium]|nr:hydrogenase maturation nickel metallochaperone HypA [Gammaproteobacteria bacterium]
MHELKIIQDIFPMLEKVAKDNHLKSINKVTLGVGKLRQVQTDFLQFAFATVAKDTIAKGAELIIKIIPITVFCDSCKKQFNLEEHVYVCPKCGGVRLEILTGKEIIIESVDGF